MVASKIIVATVHEIIPELKTKIRFYDTYFTKKGKVVRIKWWGSERFLTDENMKLIQNRLGNKVEVSITKCMGLSRGRKDLVVRRVK